MRDLGRVLIIAGITIAICGVVITMLGRSGIGRLPGDVVYRRGNFTLYFPLMTSILLSLGLTLLFWFLGRR